MTSEAIKRLRKSLGLTQEQFGREIGGVNRVTVADWEAGAHRPRGLYLAALKELAEKAKKKRK